MGIPVKGDVGQAAAAELSALLLGAPDAAQAAQRRAVLGALMGSATDAARKHRGWAAYAALEPRLAMGLRGLGYGFAALDPSRSADPRPQVSRLALQEELTGPGLTVAARCALVGPHR